MLSDARQGSLLAILFHLAFWHMDLGYFGRGLLGSWPQADIGIVLWSLSVSAGDWQTSEKLTRLCTIPEPAMFSGTWDRSPYAMEARILRPLLWFGLLEYRSEKIPNSRFGARHYYRKAALFDRLLTFDSQNGFCGGPPSLAGHAAVQCSPQIRCTHQHGPTTSAGPPVRSGSALNVDAPSRLWAPQERAHFGKAIPPNFGDIALKDFLP